MNPSLVIGGIILVALIFDYINGFHDAANSIATVVSTRVLSPGQAVMWAAFFNFVAAFGFGTAVAKTVGGGMVDLKVVTFAVIFAGLIGAIAWDLITWYFGLPISSSHALFGGYAGAAVAQGRLRGGDRFWLDHDADLHGRGARDRPGRRPDGHARHLLLLSRLAALARRSLVPAAPVDVGSRLQSHARGQRRAEDDGHRLRGARDRRVSPHGERRAAGPVLGRADGARGNRPWHAHGRVADHPYDGIEDHETAAGERLCRRNRSRRGHLHRHRVRRRDQHHAHHHGGNRRGRGDAAAVGRSLGSGRPDHVGVGADDSGRGAGWRAVYHVVSALGML